MLEEGAKIFYSTFEGQGNSNSHHGCFMEFKLNSRIKKLALAITEVNQILWFSDNQYFLLRNLLRNMPVN